MRKQIKGPLLYLVLLVLGGICHVIDRAADSVFLSTWLFCADMMIYSGLILFWIQSARRRLLPSPASTCMQLSALLMLMFLVLRTVKYRVAYMAELLKRYCWYFYYVPIILVPTLFLISSFYFGNGPEMHSRLKKYSLLVGMILTFGVITNDLHHLAFMPDPDVTIFIGVSGTYTHGVLFYAAYIWAGCMIAAGVVHLLRTTYRMRGWKKAIRPFLCVLLIPLLTAENEILFAAGLPQPFLMQEILIFCMIGVQEYCIRNGLLPHNADYETVFPHLEIPVIITDQTFAPVYRTPVSVTTDSTYLRQAVGSFVYPDPDTRLSGIGIKAGYAFFAEDESGLNHLNEELQDANDILSMENELLTREQELIAESDAIRKRNALYTRAAQAVYPAQKRISALLETAKPNTPSFRKDMTRILFMTAFVKRKANFVMLEADQGAISAEELTAAMNESFHYLSYCGIHTAARITIGSSMTCQEAMAIYDCFEAAAEALYGKTTEIWVRLMKTELMIMADTEEALTLPELPLPFTCRSEDGQTVIRVQTGGERQ